MANIISFTCPLCGNNDPHKAAYYDGALGYEAVYCACCGSYSDHAGIHQPDESSQRFIRYQKPDVAIVKTEGQNPRVILNNINFEQLETQLKALDEVTAYQEDFKAELQSIQNLIEEIITVNSKL